MGAVVKPGEPTRVRAQVLCFGHNVSGAVRAWLREKYGEEWRVYFALAHAEDMGEIFDAVEVAFLELASRRAKLDGSRVTYIVAPGLSALAMTVAAAWQGLSGSLPLILNVVRNHEGIYVPHTGTPVLDLGRFKNNIRKLRAVIDEGPEAAAEHLKGLQED